MNETFEIIPGRSIGPFQLGMPRNEVWQQSSCPITSFFKTPACTRRTDDFTLLGIHVYYDTNDCANYIAAHMPVQHNKVKHILDGNLVSGMTVGELREICSLFDRPLVSSESGFEIPLLGLHVCSHYYEDDSSLVDAISVMPVDNRDTNQS